MSRFYITIDTGTTNTRAYLWKDHTVLGVQKRQVGVRNTAIDGNNKKLRQAIAECIQSLLTDCEINAKSVEFVVASGMITSNLGLLEVPHVTAPAGLDDLAAKMQKTLIPEIFTGNFYFVPGIKNLAGKIPVDQLETMDMMRGEETEAIAVIQEFQKGDPFLIIFPGSHTKVVSIDQNGKIKGCMTTLAGELLSAITNDTILADSVGRQYVTAETYSPEMVLQGFEMARKFGVGRACFTGRVSALFAEYSHLDVANYILGVVLAEDIRAIKVSQALQITMNSSVLIVGSNPISRGLADILQYDGEFGEIKTIGEPRQGSYASIGAHLLAERLGLLG